MQGKRHLPFFNSRQLYECQRTIQEMHEMKILFIGSTCARQLQIYLHEVITS